MLRNGERPQLEIRPPGHVFEEFAAAELRSGVLQALPEKYRMPGESFYLYYPNRAHMPGKLRASIDFFR